MTVYSLDRLQQNGQPSGDIEAPSHRPANSAVLLRYEGRAPRYTSYPTAVQFAPDVDQVVYRAWLAALPTDEAISLYIHVPLCARLCWYCGCNTRAVTRRSAIADYVAYLTKEIEILAAALPGRLPVASVHLGGGTPNMLAPEDLRKVFDALRRAFSFTADVTIAAELDPAVLTQDWVAEAARQGLTRASLGVQDLSPKVQAAVNRPEPFEVVERAVGWLRQAGITSINLDLMYGLPEQGVVEVLETLDAILTLKPDRLALFGYAHVPWMKPHQRLIDESALPGPQARLDQAEAAAQRLAAEGYVRIGLDHFARADESLTAAMSEGRLRRNFQGYTNDEGQTLLGIGASSIGRTPQGYVQNQTVEVVWRAALDRGELPVARGVILTGDDQFRGEIIERLMCDMRVDLEAVSLRHQRGLEDLGGFEGALQSFLRDGLADLENGVLTVTEAGRPLVRSIASIFDAYLTREPDRHAKAI
jgi:oxygen-independent coproporphyrinogen III oxidase